ncbi:hypothetical protein JCM19231_784 [Vibrio ishigakensis]|uniref:Uncharacterized protein n=1 Tax=Vibrio ishigakensis TaxID=1481914 RepID=A0A0B8NM15_9VIBR|nr:hypothetical protein [Vibrio ishigakensis]GAM55720.1 hypothetical protein JCM19231_784 [Vibrio ishigakensis]
MNLARGLVCLFCLALLNGCNDGWDFSNQHHGKQKGSPQAQMSTSALSDALNTLYYLTVKDMTASDLPFASTGPGVARLLIPNKAFNGLTAAQADLSFDNNQPLTITDGGSPSSSVYDWHCYQSDSMSVDVDSDGMTVDGTITEYEYSNGCSASNHKVASYRFESAHLNSGFIFDSGEVRDLLQHRTLRANQWLIDSMASRVEKLFGKAWLAQWQQASKNAGEDFLTLDRQGKVVYDQLPPEMVDFNSLDPDAVLDGTVFGGGASASQKWCRIVNIPTGFDLDSQKVQTMIAVNCARSSKRYCEGHGGFPAGMQQANSPLAWSDDTYHNAMQNTLEQQARNKQGHFIVKSGAQNAFSVTPYGATPFEGALKAIFGYTDVKNADPKSPTFNNAGTNSFVGHAGHCQNEMSDLSTTGLSFKVVTKNGATGIDFITQDFN